jgi:microcompartment protein CcmL/EutN
MNDLRPALGLIEFRSIARGIMTCDFMVKKAPIELLEATPTCPGKYSVVIGGLVAPVESSMEVGLQVGGDQIIDHLLIPNIHEGVFPAIRGTTEVKKILSLGVIETFSIASCIVAADAAAKAANIILVEIRLARGLGGKAFVTLTGELYSVEAALSAATSAIGESGMLTMTTIVPDPHESLNSVII